MAKKGDSYPIVEKGRGSVAKGSNGVRESQNNVNLMTREEK